MTKRPGDELETVTLILALQTTMQPEQRIEAALKEAGLDRMGVYKLNGALQGRMANEPGLAEEYERRFDAHKRTLFDEAARAAGLDPANLDIVRDWNTVFQLQRKSAELAQQIHESVRESHAGPEERSIDGLRDATAAVLAAPDETQHDRYLEKAPLIWIDHRDDPVDLLGYFADYFDEGKLRIEGEDPVVLRFARRRVQLALTHTPADRHRAVIALNEVLAPSYEVRAAPGRQKADTLAFALLRTRDWKRFENRYPEPTRELFVTLRADVDIWNT